jgi:cytochrome c biogenesis protein
VTGTAVRGDDKGLRNVGPSVEYRLTDSSGQSHEFNNYMLPVMLDGASVFLVGTRANPNDGFRYLRLPADANYSLAEFLALRAALADESVRHEAARRFAARNAGPGTDARPLEESARRALDVFAADGLQGVTTFLEQNVPADELRRAAEIVVRLIGGAMSDVRAQARERSGLPPVALEGPAAEVDDNWLRLSVAALSDLALYPAPVLLTLTTFNHCRPACSRSAARLANRWYTWGACC